jgi:peptidoglycan/LPS O-acetylase OafA/YrhL
MTLESRDRIAAFDSLRGIAILFVVACHYLAYAPFDVAGMRAGLWLRDFGQGGVLLFFLLSGYLMWARGRDASPGSFLRRRLGKIVPAYWVNIGFVVAAATVSSVYPAFAPKDVLGNLLFLEGSLGVRPLSGVYWTLVLEVKFYLLFALVMFTPLRPLFWIVPLAAFAANAALTLAIGRGATFLVFLPAFFVGAAIAADKGNRRGRALIAAMLAVAAASLALFGQERGWQAAVFLIFDAALFLLLLRRGWSARWLSFVGSISYSLYLYHMTFGQPILEATAGQFGPVAWAALAATVTVSAFLLSWLSWRFVETLGVAAARRADLLSSPR